MDEYSKLSVKLFNILEKVGASEKSRQFHRHAAGTVETLCNSYVVKEDATIYICGGFSEGSVTPDIVGDTDVVIGLNAPPVVFDLEDKRPGISYLAEQSEHPGYVKLRVIKDGKVAMNRDIDGRDLYNFEIIDDTTLYLKHQHSSELAKIFSKASVNGPAQALVGPTGDHLFDIVLALRSENIPPYANEWLTRRRPSGWPSKEDLDKMSKMGCLFVGVGHPDNEDEGIQWRLSFILQERLLMSILNSVQHKVYILMKMLKKDFIESQVGESISSYCCKTCVLHVSENTPTCLWTKENLIGCLLLCLRYLSDHLIKTRCPNIFVREQNLFERNKIRTNRNKLVDLFKNMLESNRAFLYNIKSDDIGQLLSADNISILNTSRQYGKSKYHFQIKQSMITLFGVVRDLLLFQVRPSSYQTLCELLDALLNPEQSIDENLKTASAYIVPWIQLRAGMSLAAKALSNRNHPAFACAIEEALEHIERGSEADLMNSRLAKATILFQLERYQECNDIVHEIENHVTQYTITSCVCDLPRRLPGIPVSLEVYYHIQVARDWGDKNMNEIRENMFAGCFCFLPCDEGLLPKPLQYERRVCKHENNSTVYDYFRSWTMVDAKVYMYTLLYMIGCVSQNRQQKDEAITKLTKTLQNDGNAGHREVTYNVLGWIMIQEDKYLSAVRYFLKSWEVRSINNAAKYHVQELFGRLNENGGPTEDLLRQLLPFVCWALQYLA